MQQMQGAAIKEYFFGDIKRTLSPHTQQIGFDDATIYKIRDCTDPSHRKYRFKLIFLI
jgi:polyribonucleotide 5'-hydroxyl-kinase